MPNYPDTMRRFYIPSEDYNPTMVTEKAIRAVISKPFYRMAEGLFHRWLINKIKTAPTPLAWACIEVIPQTIRRMIRQGTLKRIVENNGSVFYKIVAK